jgi:hypothetical protein
MTRILVTAVVVVALAGAAATQDRHSGDWETLEGTWNLDVTPVGRPPAQILTTFSRGGTTTGNGNAANPSRRSPWQGVWSRITYLDFASTWERYDFDADGNWTGRAEFRQSIRVSPSLEEYTGRSQTRMFDRAGNLLSVTEGTLHARRVNVQLIP